MHFILVMLCGAFFTISGLVFLFKKSVELSPSKVVRGSKTKIMGLIWMTAGLVNIWLQLGGGAHTSIWILGPIAFVVPIITNPLLSDKVPQD